MNDLKRIEAAARAISTSKGRNPDDKASYGTNQDAIKRLGFPEMDPFKHGVWVCDIEEAAKIVAVIDALRKLD